MKDWYKNALLDPRWDQKRKIILKRDNYKCTDCGAINVKLHVHHIKYKEYGTMPWDYDNDQLTSLCDKCHKKIHNIKDIEYNFINNSFETIYLAGPVKGCDMWRINFLEKLFECRTPEYGLLKTSVGVSEDDEEYGFMLNNKYYYGGPFVYDRLYKRYDDFGDEFISRGHGIIEDNSQDLSYIPNFREYNKKYIINFPDNSDFNKLRIPLIFNEDELNYKYSGWEYYDEIYDEIYERERGYYYNHINPIYFNNDEIIHNSLSQILDCDIMIVDFNQNISESYGTIAEIGYAFAKGKKIYGVGVRNDELWFVQSMCKMFNSIDDLNIYLKNN